MRKLYTDSLLLFFRSKKLMRTYLFMMALVMLLFVFCSNNYLEYQDFYSTLFGLTLPSLFFIAFFIYFGYELTVKIYDHSLTEYMGIYPYGLLKMYGAILLSLLTLVALPSLLFLIFLIEIVQIFLLVYLQVVGDI